MHGFISFFTIQYLVSTKCLSKDYLEIRKEKNHNLYLVIYTV